MEIKVNCSNLKSYGKKIKDKSSDFEKKIKKFEQIIDSINTAWDGSDALKYINVMKEKYIQTLNDTKSLLDDYGDYLSGASDSYEVLDEVFASKNIDV